MSTSEEAPRPRKTIEIIPVPEMKELGEYFQPNNELLSESEKEFRRYIDYVKKAEVGIEHFNAAIERMASNKLHSVSASDLHDYAMSYQSWINSWHGREKMRHGDWARGHKDGIVQILRDIDPTLDNVNSTHFEDFINAYSESFEKRYWTALCKANLAWLEYHMRVINSFGSDIAEKKNMLIQGRFYDVFHHVWSVLETHGDSDVAELLKSGKETLLKAKDFLKQVVAEEQTAVTQSWKK